ncbi:MAG: CRISPR-associated endonuclease Cas3'', partial [Kiritimatiellia bacterium]|nr:CRISPR-associated endonuclease Cas3'' [Kiritimatiellia bacterium]
MIPKIYAHSLPDKPKEEWQPLDEHLQAVAGKAREFASTFSSGDWAYNAGWLHDLGKADGSFQSYLLRENGLDDSEYDSSGGGRINHSSAGAAFAEKKLKLSGRILAYLIAGHHAGLPDWYPADTGNAALQIRLQEGKENLERIYSQAEKLLAKLQPLSRPPDFLKKPEDFHLWMR